MNTLVTFELAKLLKEKSFNIPTHNYFGKHKYDKKYQNFIGYNDEYWGDNYEYDWNTNGEPFKPFSKDCYSAPTIAQIVMWIYEKHGIWLYVGMKSKEDGTDESWFIPNARYVPSMTKNGFEIDPIIYMCRKSPTEAYLAGIEYILKEIL